jgi:hypothetical protein
VRYHLKELVMAGKIRTSIFAGIAVSALGLGGCANDGNVGSLFTTGAIGGAGETTSAVLAPKLDPACTTLATQIDTLRKEGTIDRLEKVADGKGANVQVQRVALKKQSELNKANADFQAKCAPAVPRTASVAAVVPAAPAQAAAPVAAAKAKAAKAVSAIAPSGVTVAAPDKPLAQ